MSLQYTGQSVYLFCSLWDYTVYSRVCFFHLPGYTCVQLYMTMAMNMYCAVYVWVCVEWLNVQKDQPAGAKYSSALCYFILNCHCWLLSAHLIVTVLHLFNSISLQCVKETGVERQRGNLEKWESKSKNKFGKLLCKKCWNFIPKVTTIRKRNKFKMSLSFIQNNTWQPATT